MQAFKCLSQYGGQAVPGLQNPRSIELAFINPNKELLGVINLVGLILERREKSQMALCEPRTIQITGLLLGRITQ
jgi:hypothetical protein